MDCDWKYSITACRDLWARESDGSTATVMRQMRALSSSMSLDSFPDLSKEGHSFDTLKPQSSTSFRRSLAGDLLQGDVLEPAAAVVREWKYQQQSSGYKQKHFEQGRAGSWIQPGLLCNGQDEKNGIDSRQNRDRRRCRSHSCALDARPPPTAPRTAGCTQRTENDVQ